VSLVRSRLTSFGASSLIHRSAWKETSSNFALRTLLKFAKKVPKIRLMGDAPPCSKPLSSFAMEKFLHIFQQPASLR
jgi:hypothetical protein